MLWRVCVINVEPILERAGRPSAQLCNEEQFGNHEYEVSEIRKKRKRKKERPGSESKRENEEQRSKV